MSNLLAAQSRYQTARQAESFQGGQISDMCQAAAAMLQILAHEPCTSPCSAAQPSSTSSSTHAAGGAAWPTPSPWEWQSISATAVRVAATAYWLQLKIRSVEEVELDVQYELLHTLLRLLAVLLSGMMFICCVTFRLFVCWVCHQVLF